MQQLSRRNVVKGIACAASLGVFVSARANAYPARPVKLVVPYAAGGALDLVARRVAQDLTTRLGQPFIVDNKPGANGQLGTANVARSPGDGYTLLLTADTGFSIPSMTSVVPYDTTKDFIPVSMVSELSLLLIARSTFAPSSVDEIIKFAKSAPGVPYGSLGVGSQSHLFMEQFARRGGIDLLNVPFGGNGPMTTALLGGQIALALQGVAGPLQHIRSGQVKGIAFASSARSPLLPDVPTFAESGMPGYAARAWHGIFAPKDTSPEIIQILTRAIWDGVSGASYTDGFLVPNGFDPRPSVAPDKFAAFVLNDQRRYESLMKQLNLNSTAQKS